MVNIEKLTISTIREPVLLKFILKKRFYLFIFRERGRERGREGKKHPYERKTSIGHLPYASPTWTRDWTPTQAAGPQPGIQPVNVHFVGRHPTEPHRSWLTCIF